LTSEVPARTLGISGPHCGQEDSLRSMAVNLDFCNED
jgi:hypothetical protein